MNPFSFSGGVNADEKSGRRTKYYLPDWVIASGYLGLAKEKIRMTLVKFAM